MSRRAVPLLLALPPMPAWAAACDKERPGWDPSHGPATGLDELVLLFTSLPGLAMLGALTLAMLTGHKRYFAIAALFSGLVAAALALPPDEITRAAIDEGCVGPSTLPIAACLAITAVSVAALAWPWLRGGTGTRI